MKKLMVLVLGVMLSTVAFAADVTTLKIGVVDVQAVIQKAPQTEKFNQALKKKFEERQNKLQAQNKALQDEQAKLNRDASVLSQNDRTKLQEKIISDERELQRAVQAYQDDLGAARNEAMQKLFGQIQVAVNAVAKEGKLDIVLEKQAAPYVSAQMDITDQVVKALAKS